MLLKFSWRKSAGARLHIATNENALQAQSQGGHQLCSGSCASGNDIHRAGQLEVIQERSRASQQRSRPPQGAGPQWVCADGTGVSFVSDETEEARCAT